MDYSELETWKEWIGVSASVWTILQMLSPVPTCYYFIRKQTVGDMIVTPYAVAFTSCSLWLLYGIIIGDSTVVKVNAIASVLQFCYTLCYYIYCIKKGEVRKQVGLGLLTITCALFYSLYEYDLERLNYLFGLLCSSVTVLFFASPLANMKYVLKIWNSESLPRLLIATTFIVSLQWLFYGYLTDDTFITVTNFLGTLLSGAQLILVCIIPRHSKYKLTNTTI